MLVTWYTASTDGGSSQLSDVLSSRSSTLRKHTYDIQGNATVPESIARLLGSFAADVDSLMSTTVLATPASAMPGLSQDVIANGQRTMGLA